MPTSSPAAGLLEDSTYARPGIAISNVAQNPRVDVLIPTAGRKTGLAVVLTSLLAQSEDRFDVVVSDQSDSGEVLESIEIVTVARREPGSERQ